jgi:RTX calcium-binding nonapeptide repeat (4 copies)
MRRFLIVAALALLVMPGAALAANLIRGTADGEPLDGTPEADLIFARGGDDTVKALAGDDRAHGGKGDDTVAGDDGNDRLKGGGGKDKLDGGVGDDVIDGRGDGRTADEIACGEGDDTVRASRNDVVAADCEHVSQPGAENGAVAPSGDDEAKAKGPKGDKQPPFGEDGKPGKGPKVVATAAQTPAPAETAAEACKAEKHAMGTKLFKQTYGAKSASRATAACIAKRGPAAAADAKNASHACKAERAQDPAAFAEKYGTGKNKKNAHGKCVSMKTQEATEAETEARVNAAEACKTERAADRAAFTEKYGTNKNKKNAFGKCVSKTARAA